MTEQTNPGCIYVTIGPVEDMPVQHAVRELRGAVAQTSGGTQEIEIELRGHDGNLAVTFDSDEDHARRCDRVKDYVAKVFFAINAIEPGVLNRARLTKRTLEWWLPALLGSPRVRKYGLFAAV